jgi:phospholipid/cholesterol/gamma-HCH transport system substrate-binding protein
MKNSLEFKVGAMTLAALFVLTFAILFLSNFSFSAGSYVVTADFNFLGGLKVNAPVRYAGGIDVGRVKAIRPDNGKAAVDLLITQKDFKLKTDSLVALYGDGLLGSRYVEIDSNLGTGDELKTGESLEGKDANNLDKTFSQLGDVMETFEQMMGDPKSKASILSAFDNLNKSSAALLSLTDTSRDKITTILSNLSNSSGQVNKIVNSVSSISTSLATLSSTLDKKDLNESIKNLNSTLITMNQLAQDVHNGKGAIGVLLQDQQTADNLKGLVEELKAHPWKLLWKK